MCSGKLSARDTAVSFGDLKRRERFASRGNHVSETISDVSSCLTWIWREGSSPGSAGTKETFGRKPKVCSQKEGRMQMIL